MLFYDFPATVVIKADGSAKLDLSGKKYNKCENIFDSFEYKEAGLKLSRLGLINKSATDPETAFKHGKLFHGKSEGTASGITLSVGDCLQVMSSGVYFNWTNGLNDTSISKHIKSYLPLIHWGSSYDQVLFNAEPKAGQRIFNEDYFIRNEGLSILDWDLDAGITDETIKEKLFDDFSKMISTVEGVAFYFKSPRGGAKAGFLHQPAESYQELRNIRAGIYELLKDLPVIEGLHFDVTFKDIRGHYLSPYQPVFTGKADPVIVEPILVEAPAKTDSATRALQKPKVNTINLNLAFLSYLAYDTVFVYTDYDCMFAFLGACARIDVDMNDAKITADIKELRRYMNKKTGQYDQQDPDHSDGVRFYEKRKEFYIKGKYTSGIPKLLDEYISNNDSIVIPYKFRQVAKGKGSDNDHSDKLAFEHEHNVEFAEFLYNIEGAAALKVSDSFVTFMQLIGKCGKFCRHDKSDCINSCPHTGNYVKAAHNLFKLLIQYDKIPSLWSPDLPVILSIMGYFDGFADPEDSPPDDALPILELAEQGALTDFQLDRVSYGLLLVYNAPVTGFSLYKKHYPEASVSNYISDAYSMFNNKNFNLMEV